MKRTSLPLRTRRAFVFALGGAAAWPLAARAQQAEKRYTVGILSAGSENPALRTAFSDALPVLGWVEGKHVFFEHRYADNRLERLPELAAELVRLKVDVIAAAGTLAPLAAKRATSTGQPYSPMRARTRSTAPAARPIGSNRKTQHAKRCGARKRKIGADDRRVALLHHPPISNGMTIFDTKFAMTDQDTKVSAARRNIGPSSAPRFRDGETGALVS
jgi:hypothetical protein